MVMPLASNTKWEVSSYTTASLLMAKPNTTHKNVRKSAYRTPVNIQDLIDYMNQKIKKGLVAVNALPSCS